LRRLLEPKQELYLNLVDRAEHENAAYLPAVK